MRGCTLEKIIPYTDKFLYDIKAIDGTLHKRLTGRDNALMLDNLLYTLSDGYGLDPTLNSTCILE